MDDVTAELTDSDDLEITSRVRKELGPRNSIASKSTPRFWKEMMTLIDLPQRSSTLPQEP